MRRFFLLGLVAAVAACGGSDPTPRRAPTGFAETQNPECYTVDLFTDIQFKRPAAEVPEDWRAFAGRWGAGAWDGAWCHDLYVLEVLPDGLVRLVETHAPYEPWGKRATAYRRTARIGEDGRMRLRYGQVQVEYWVEDGKLYGVRREAGQRRNILLTRDSA